MKIKLLFCLTVFQSTMLLGMEPDKSGNEMIEESICIIPDKMRYMHFEPYGNGSCEKKFLEDVFDITLENSNPLVEILVCPDKSGTYLESYGHLFREIFLKTHPKYKKYSEIVKKLTSKETFNIHLNKTKLHLRKIDTQKKQDCHLGKDKVYANTFPDYLPYKLLYGTKEGGTIEFRAFGLLPVRLKCDQLTSPYGKHCYHDTPTPFHDVLQTSLFRFISSQWALRNK